jgi:hypothetical protein
MAHARLKCKCVPEDSPNAEKLLYIVTTHMHIHTDSKALICNPLLHSFQVRVLDDPWLP